MRRSASGSLKKELKVGEGGAEGGGVGDPARARLGGAGFDMAGRGGKEEDEKWNEEGV